MFSDTISCLIFVAGDAMLLACWCVFMANYVKVSCDQHTAATNRRDTHAGRLRRLKSSKTFEVRFSVAEMKISGGGGGGGCRDVSSLLSVWESHVKKHRQRQKKEQERKDRSALTRIEQQWQYRLYCRTRDTRQRNVFDNSLNTSTHNTHSVERRAGEGPEGKVLDGPDAGADALLFRLSGEQWQDLPGDLQWKTFLLEWHVSGTKIQKLPDYLASFSLVRVLHLAKNKLEELPLDIGKLLELRELNVSYNRLSAVPAQLGMCRNLERLELAGNRNLSELPFELSSLKRLAHLDIAENGFASIPVCALRMSALRFLDLSDNRLSDLPQDMDRLHSLATLFLHNNRLSYLPQCLTNIATLKMVVVSGDHLVCVPTQLCSSPNIKFIRLYASPASDDNTTKKTKADVRGKRRGRRAGRQEEDDEEETKDSREKEFMAAYVSTLEDREEVPYSTTKVNISCLL
ncbi:leucine-rich repeat-containing protein 2 isoform X1 [Phycodurus eques]|uniref:leucine-rich repeat-containing protein 2 isoform X1 n=2 Tax=Phycodurus eques TaxID=693459 RepID=UPI002ACE0BA8|nr:leucine-rich repeat-containing protein 2 isoform X1 [Phycodurus eques]